MSIVDSFLEKKKVESNFVSLGDGEILSVERLVEIKSVIKTDPAGKEKDALRLVCDVVTSLGVIRKNFDNSTAFFANQLIEQGIVDKNGKVAVGCSLNIKRVGKKGDTKTKYFISDVILPPTGAPTPTPTPAV